LRCAGKLTCLLEQLHAWLFSQKPNIPLSGKRLRRSSSAFGVLQRVSRLREKLAGAASLDSQLDACREVVVVCPAGKENRAPGPLAPLVVARLDTGATPESSPERSPTKSWGPGSAGSVRSLARTYSEDEEVSVRSCSVSCIRWTSFPFEQCSLACRWAASMLLGNLTYDPCRQC
jgi:hypothetical protein